MVHIIWTISHDQDIWSHYYLYVYHMVVYWKTLYYIYEKILLIVYKINSFKTKWNVSGLKIRSDDLKKGRKLRSFLVNSLWWGLAGLDKIAKNIFLLVIRSEKINIETRFWRPRLITWPKISHGNCL